MGSVHAYETAAGKRYRIAYRRPDNKQTNERGFTTKKAAELRLAEVEVGKAKGDYVNPADARETISAIATGWLAAREHVMKPSSYRPVKSAWETHVKPRWGARKVGSVRNSEVQEWVSELAREKSATMVLRAYGVLAAVLDAAVKDRRLPKNVARDVTLPRKAAAGRAYLTHQQVEDLAATSRYPLIVRLLAYTGLRWGEATGLRVKHVDLARRRLSVEENAVMVGATVIVGTPKTHETRTVPYPSFLDDAIATAIKGKRPEDLLLGAGKKHMRLPNSRDGWFAAAVKRAQSADKAFPRVTPHDLRHTAASLAIRSGANVKAVQRMLGHASAAMTLDTYADLFDDDLEAVATALDKARTDSVVVNALSPGHSEE